MFIPPSELILNPDKSIYHLNLLPGDLATTIITVGDMDRVDLISRHFDTILLEKKHREFRTITGEIDSKKISVIATGIGPDNIDIVFNEIDALFNVDFDSRTVKTPLRKLNFIRLGTSGSMRKEIPVDSIVISRHAIGMDGLLNTYQAHTSQNARLLKQLNDYMPEDTWQTYVTDASEKLGRHFSGVGTEGITITANGFYGPQSRRIRLSPKLDIIKLFQDFEYNDLRVTNLEMETAAIYGLSTMLGHDAISLNAILANRVDNSFSKDPAKVINQLIENSLGKIIALTAD
jgi:uridine phosphorylase